MPDDLYSARAIETELRFRRLLEEEGFEPPDEVVHESDPPELVFLWHEEKLAVVVELWGDGADDDLAFSGPAPPV
jgi:hypothetical protein